MRIQKMMKVRIVKKQHVAEEKKTYKWWQWLIGGAGLVYSIVSVLSMGWLSRTDVQWDMAMYRMDFMIKFNSALMEVQQYFGFL